MFSYLWLILNFMVGLSQTPGIPQYLISELLYIHSVWIHISKINLLILSDYLNQILDLNMILDIKDYYFLVSAVWTYLYVWIHEYSGVNGNKFINIFAGGHFLYFYLTFCFISLSILQMTFLIEEFFNTITFIHLLYYLAFKITFYWFS